MTKLSYKPEVIADSSGTWASNNIRFATRDEAEVYVDDLEGRWTLVRMTRVLAVPELPTHRLDYTNYETDGWKLVPLPRAPER